MKRLLAVLGILTLAAAATWAEQRQGRGGIGRGYVQIAGPGSFDGAFQFCRVAFRGNRYGDGGGWAVDYPRADINLSIRLSELTHTRVSFDAARDPNHLVVRLTDEAMFQCPFIMMTEVGAAYFDDAEAAALRAYLLKGGFLWADDFWGEYAWDVWADQIGKVLPRAEYPIRDVPLDHPVFHSQFIVNKVPQIASMNFWAGSGGGTSERGADSAEAHARAIVDRHGRIMVFITHNTDLGDSYEREADNPEYFLRFSVDGYAMGINILLYAMTH
ncbi:MAG: DUF4159 domain-containing protein [Vicinamibacterales bacterium]